MEVARAKNILNSLDEITVLYKGDKIWIDRVDEESARVEIHPMNASADHLFVPAEVLEEA